ncbi:speckle-type POZ protein-like [Chironomus tepperi]|uniref:speckle-type POZ protein-like n=1 Tax=Chironomus tepperi TaxID=113505 RepID=UPI00391F0EB5
MEEAFWTVGTFEANYNTKLSTEFRNESLVLDITQHEICPNCKKIRENVHCSCFCGYYAYKKCLEIKATVNHNCELKTDLEKALFNESLSDFSFIVNDEKVPVNKFILAARSPVFAKMFYSEFKEKNENQQILGIKISTEAFKELIRYIYINEVCDLNKHEIELLHAADFYQIDSLRAICEKELLTTVNMTNANVIFQAAHLYRCSDELKEASYNFIKKMFQIKNYVLPQEYINLPEKVKKIIKKKESLENELCLA